MDFDETLLIEYILSAKMVRFCDNLQSVIVREGGISRRLPGRQAVHVIACLYSGSSLFLAVWSSKLSTSSTFVTVYSDFGATARLT